MLIYGHYDVQPVDPLDLWDSPPFEPEIRDGVIFARGSTDNKGQNLAHILGVEQQITENGDLPVNLTFLIEGEEEIGSPNLDPFLEANREALKCDVVAVSDTGMVAPGVPTLTYGLRGVACLEFRLTGPNVDLHSGIYGGAVANPAMVAAQLASSLQDASSGKIKVAGFYDAVKPLQDWEKKTWDRLPDGDSEMFEQTGVPGLFGEDGFDSYERRLGSSDGGSERDWLRLSGRGLQDRHPQGGHGEAELSPGTGPGSARDFEAGGGPFARTLPGLGEDRRRARSQRPRLRHGPQRRLRIGGANRAEGDF